MVSEAVPAAAAPRTPQGAPAQREAWIDVAKGIAIILVVVFHSVMYMVGAGLAPGWVRLTYTLDTFRMPLFFFMSGMVAVRALQLSYANLFRKRIVLLLYLYVLWSTLQTVFLNLMPPIGSAEGKSGWLSLLTLFIAPNANLWFIYALPIFLTVAWLARRLHPAIQVAGAACISAVFGAGWFGTAGSPWEKTGRYLFFFILAIHIGRFVRALAPRTRLWHALVLSAVYVGVILVLTYTHIGSIPFVLVAGGCVAVSVGIAWAVLISRVPWLDLIRFIGTRTLPIYLVHTFPMIALAAALYPISASIPGVVGELIPPVLVVVAIALALGLYALLKDVPGIFTVPVADWTRVRLPEKALRGDADRRGE